jgi:hypothetical protein
VEFPLQLIEHSILVARSPWGPAQRRLRSPSGQRLEYRIQSSVSVNPQFNFGIPTPPPDSQLPVLQQKLDLSTRASSSGEFSTVFVHSFDFGPFCGPQLLITADNYLISQFSASFGRVIVTIYDFRRPRCSTFESHSLIRGAFAPECLMIDEISDYAF